MRFVNGIEESATAIWGVFDNLLKLLCRSERELDKGDYSTGRVRNLCQTGLNTTYIHTCRSTLQTTRTWDILQRSIQILFSYTKAFFSPRTATFPTAPSKRSKTTGSCFPCQRMK